jgi:hypothetical protein
MGQNNGQVLEGFGEGSARFVFAGNLLWGDDEAAGDAVAGIACRVGLHIIGLGMDDDRRPPVSEDGVRGSGVEGHILVHEGRLNRAVGTHGQILRHVAVVVAFRVFVAVLLAGGIEVSSGALEVGRIALGVLVDVDSVFARRQVLEGDLELDTRFGLLEHDVSGIFAVGGLDHNLDGLRSGCERGQRQGYQC